jgi:hypothetical protein
MQTIALDKNDYDRVQVGLRLGNAKINFISFCYSTRLALTLRKE